MRLNTDNAANTAIAIEAARKIFEEEAKSKEPLLINDYAFFIQAAIEESVYHWQMVAAQEWRNGFAAGIEFLEGIK